MAEKKEKIKVVTEERTHAELSPSHTDRWWNCPGSVAACRGLKGVQSEYASEGVAAHALLEKCLNNVHDCCVFDHVGEIIEGFEVTEEMAEAVAVAIDFVRAELQIGGFLLVEQKVEIVKGEIWGRLDISIVRPFDRIIVADYKHGRGVRVTATDNPQLLNYALGITRLHEADNIELVVIQPRTIDEEKISRWCCDMEYLYTFETELQRHIALTKEPNAELVPGNHCKWCLAKATCPALRGELSTAMAPVVKNLELVFPPVVKLSSEQIAVVLEYQDRFEDWFKAVGTHALALLESGIPIPRHELGKKKANRRWSNEPEVVRLFSDLGDELYVVKLKSPAQIEKLVGKERKSEIETLTEIPDNGYTIKRSKS